MPSPKLAVDIIIEYPDGEIVLVKRDYEPFRGHWALPGGGVEIGETVEQAAIREAEEETSVIIRLNRIVGVYSDPDRDPRGHTVSIVYHATPVGGGLKAGSDAAEVLKTSGYLDIPLAFDHDKVVRDWRQP